MTQLLIDVVDISGGTHPDDKVRLWAPQHRADGDRVVSTSPVDVPLVDGQATVDVLPGPARVQIMTQGVVDSAAKRVTIPDEPSITLRTVIEDGLEWEPEIISRVAALTSRAESAATRAEGVAESTHWQGDRLSVMGQLGPSLAGPQGPKGDEGEPGSEGPQGPKGDPGEDGTGFTILGSVPSASSLPTGASPGDGYLAEDTGRVWVWSGAEWVDLGTIQGPKGDKGDQGPQGDKGDPGPKGDKGDPGPKGDKGDSGDGAGDVLWSELNPVLDGKAPVSHDHALTDVTGLMEALETAGGPPVIVSTTPPEDTDAIWVNPDEVPPTSGPGGGPTDWGDIQDKPDTYPPGPHSHSQSEVEGLEAALAGKASTDHTHSEYATTTQVEARTPEIRVVSSPELATSPGVLYVVMED